jgi:hypothetical protein
MNSFGHVEFLDEAIRTQLASLRWEVCLAITVVMIGVGLFVVGQIWPSLQGLEGILALGGSLVGTVAALPIKDVFARRDRLTALRYLRREYEKMQREPGPRNAEAAHRLDETFRRVVEKALGV